MSDKAPSVEMRRWRAWASVTQKDGKIVIVASRVCYSQEHAEEMARHLERVNTRRNLLAWGGWAEM